MNTNIIIGIAIANKHLPLVGRIESYSSSVDCKTFSQLNN